MTVADRGPHASGILTMPIFLAKYGSRRARAHVVYSEPIHDRLGLPPGARAIAASPTTVAIALDDGVAILRDRRHLARFPGSPPAAGALAAGADRIAIRRGDAIEVWRLTDQRRMAYAVPGALAAAFTGDRADQLATAVGVALLDASALVPTAVRATAADHLFGLAGGDLVIAARGATTRLSIAASDDEVRWRAAVEPVVRRVCSRCHHPGGSGRSISRRWRRGTRSAAS